MRLSQHADSAPPAWVLAVVWVFSVSVLVGGAVAIVSWRARAGLLTRRAMIRGLVLLGVVMAVGLVGYAVIAETQGTRGMPGVAWVVPLQVLAFLLVTCAVVITRRRHGAPPGL